VLVYTVFQNQKFYFGHCLFYKENKITATVGLDQLYF